MDIEINFTGETSDQLKSELYHFLKDHEDNNLLNVDWIEVNSKKGEMGQAPAAGISSIVASSQLAVVELFKTLQVWIKMYDKDLTIKNRHGDEFIFRGRISEKSLMKLAEKFIGVDSVPKKKATRRKKPITKTKTTAKSPTKTKAPAKIAAKKKPIAKSTTTKTPDK